MAAILALVGAVVLVLYAPKATVAGVALVKVNVSVQCSSVWSQETHHAQPAELTLNGHSTVPLAAAQSACQNASTTIKHIAAGLAAGGVVAIGVSLLLRRSRLAR
jgi:ABC-type nitrate/sulfonate/bicarbonate transport system permease component